MAAKRPNGPKRKQTAQEKVKRSQAAKKKQRVHGGPHSGEFAKGPQKNKHAFGQGAGYSGAKPFMQFGESGSHHDVIYQHNLNKAVGGEVTPEQYALHATRSELAGGSVRLDSTDLRQTEPIRTRVDKNRARNDQKANWQKGRGVYTNTEAVSKGKYKSATAFINEDLVGEHKAWIDKQLKDPHSAFSAGLRQDSSGGVANATKASLSPGQRNRVRLYTEGLQEGLSHEEAMGRLKGERRGRKPSGRSSRSSSSSSSSRRTGLEPGVGVTPGRKGKYTSSAPSSKELRVGVSSQGVQRLSTVRKNHPGMSEVDAVRTQQAQREYLANEMMKDHKWAHETKRANIMGGREQKEGPDRVVFFTTSLGSPAPSVPTDSLVGQYIVRKRKAIASKNGLAKPAELKGRFPEAVRDLHVFEASTGWSLGAEGRYGVYQRSGWRNSKGSSRNFGKPVPVGSSVLYKSGQPIYDSDGNLRYGEGATRAFNYNLKDVGFRVFIG